jgi:hypothetical protein
VAAGGSKGAESYCACSPQGGGGAGVRCSSDTSYIHEGGGEGRLGVGGDRMSAGDREGEKAGTVTKGSAWCEQAALSHILRCVCLPLTIYFSRFSRNKVFTCLLAGSRENRGLSVHILYHLVVAESDGISQRLYHTVGRR